MYERAPTSTSASGPGGQRCWTYAKLLIKHVLAGILIGKNGATVSEIRRSSGASIRISAPACDNFSGVAQDRSVVVSGPSEAVTLAVIRIVTKICEVVKDDEEDSDVSVRFLIPQSTVPLLIGTRGSRVEEIREKYRCKIRIIEREGGCNFAGSALLPSGAGEDQTTQEHVVLITGRNENLIEASVHVLAVMQEDPRLDRIMTAPRAVESSPPVGGYGPPVGQPGREGNVGPYGQSNGSNPDCVGVYGGFGMGHVRGSPVRRPLETAGYLNRQCEIFTSIPDRFIGKLVGKFGSAISQIKGSSGAGVEISKAGEYVPGTSERLVTFSGTITQVHYALDRIIQRLWELEESEAGWEAREAHFGQDVYDRDQAAVAGGVADAEGVENMANKLQPTGEGQATNYS